MRLEDEHAKVEFPCEICPLFFSVLFDILVSYYLHYYVNDTHCSHKSSVGDIMMIREFDEFANEQDYFV